MATGKVIAQVTRGKSDTTYALLHNQTLSSLLVGAYLEASLP
jgi:hypothetical protein